MSIPPFPISGAVILLKLVQGKGIPHDERCRTRTMEFFRHYVAATWIGHTVNATVSLDAYSDVEKIFETIRLEFRHHIQATPWMDNQTRQNALDKIDTMSIELGYSTDVRSHISVGGFILLIFPVEP